MKVICVDNRYFKLSTNSFSDHVYFESIRIGKIYTVYKTKTIDFAFRSYIYYRVKNDHGIMCNFITYCFKPVLNKVKIL